MILTVSRQEPVGPAHVFAFALHASVFIRVIVKRVGDADEHQFESRRVLECFSRLLQARQRGILDSGRALRVLIEGDRADLFYARRQRSPLCK
jgi:hypothetical protein